MTLEVGLKYFIQCSDVDEWTDALLYHMPRYDIDTNLRVAGFIAQVAHESNYFRNTEENLNYSSHGLLRTFRRYFRSIDETLPFVNSPERLANYVYMDKNRINPLGNIYPGDGWRFRGRGLMQLTGRTNYERFGRVIGKSAEETAEMLSTIDGMVESACHFWKSRHVNRFADRKDLTGMTRLINGGTIGMRDRRKKYEEALDIFVYGVIQSSLLKRGDRGVDVAILQKRLGITADGIFGLMTENAVKRFQEENRLTVDGIVGQQTLRVLEEEGHF